MFLCTSPAAQTAQGTEIHTTKSPIMQDWVFRLGLADSYELHPINTVIWKIIEASDSLTQHQSSPWNTLTYNRVAQQHLQFTGCLIKQFNKKYMYHVVRGTGQGIITSTRWFGIKKLLRFDLCFSIPYECIMVCEIRIQLSIGYL